MIFFPGFYVFLMDVRKYKGGRREGREMKAGILAKVGVAAIALCMLICLSLTPVKASSLMEDMLTEAETDEDYAEDSNTPRTRSNHLNLGNVTIKKLDVNECYVTGLTQAYHSCDKLFLDLTLEQKSGGVYTVYKSWSFTGLNASSLSRGIDVIVPKNYFYRVSGYHAAQEGNIKESTTTQTKGVWIGS